MLEKDIGRFWSFITSHGNPLGLGFGVRGHVHGYGLALGSVLDLVVRFMVWVRLTIMI